MKLKPHLQQLDTLSTRLMDELWGIVAAVNLDDPASLAKDEAFFNACNRYDAETDYFNAKHSYYSEVLPSKELALRMSGYHELLTTKYFPDHIIFRSQVVRSLPGKIVSPHIDLRLYHQLSHRVHAVLSTNERCRHVYFDEAAYEMDVVKMEAGFLYDFDNVTPHATFNFGTTNRIHIISDVIDKKWALRYKSIFLSNPNFIPPGLFDLYYTHLRGIEARYGGKEGLQLHYEQSINIASMNNQ
jgi:hypothetical protein